LAKALGLTAEEQQRLAKMFRSISTNLGADAARNSPGKSYDDWRASLAYQDWLQLVRENLPAIVAEK